MDRDDEVLPIEKKWGTLLRRQPYGSCPELGTLQDMVERGLGAAMDEETKQHLLSCANCREIVEQLRLLHTEWEVEAEPKPKRAPTLLQRLRQALVAPGFVLAAATVVILLFLLRSDRARLHNEQKQRLLLQQQVAQERSRAETAQRERDQNAHRLQEEKANAQRLARQVHDLKNRPDQVVKDDTALIQLASKGLSIRTPAGFEILRGGDPNHKDLLLTPVGSVVRTLHPRFTWTAVPGADSYQVVLTPYSGTGANIHLDGTKRIWSPWLDVNNWNMAARNEAASLKPGQSYEWQIAWRVKGTQVGLSSAAHFETIDSKSEERLENATLAVGILQAQSGLLDEAEQSFASVKAQNPHNTAAVRLLKALRKKRAEIQHHP